ncbi:MAG TPA: nuclear transport factor 2 family protein, partial [Dehalococcoidia bacterium]
PTGLTEIGYRLIGVTLTATYGPNYSLLSLDVERPATPAEITVAAFYRALSTRDFDAAYSLLSPAYQATHPFSSWKAGYANTQDIEADVDLGNAPGEVTVAITASDRTPAGGRTVSFVCRIMVYRARCKCSARSAARPCRDRRGLIK